LKKYVKRKKKSILPCLAEERALIPIFVYLTIFENIKLEITLNINKNKLKHSPNIQHNNVDKPLGRVTPYINPYGRIKLLKQSFIVTITILLTMLITFLNTSLYNTL
jgi:hypothetical protein